MQFYLGISSGVLCVILGIYENLISRILHFFKNFKENFLFFLPLIIGGIISIILMSKILLVLLEKYNFQTSFSFIGLIVGCIPSVFKQANIEKNKNNNFIKYLILIFTFTFSIYLLAIEKNTIDYIQDIPQKLSNYELFKSGFFMSAGIIIPRCKQYYYFNAT